MSADYPIAPGPWQRVLAWFMGSARNANQQLDALDGLRGLAVLVVVASHLSNLGMHLLPRVNLTGIGKSGVYLFFVLSAFLLTRALLRVPMAQWSRSRLWANYALRRVLRIWPLYLVVLLASWVLTLQGVQGWHYHIDTAALLGHLSLREGQSVLWSIPVEFTFYLWLPLIALALAWVRQRGGSMALEAALVGVALAVTSLVWTPAASAVNDVRLGPYLPIFLCGAWAASVDARLQARPRSAGSIRGWGVASVLSIAALVLGIPAVWAMLSSAPIVPALNHRWFLFFGLAWATLLLGVLHGGPLLRAVFAWTPLRWVGVVSFSVYLWHMVVLEGLLRIGVQQWPYPGGVVLAASLLAAGISFLLFERPWRMVRLAREEPGVPATAKW